MLAQSLRDGSHSSTGSHGRCAGGAAGRSGGRDWAVGAARADGDAHWRIQPGAEGRGSGTTGAARPALIPADGGGADLIQGESIGVMSDRTERRERMVVTQIAARGIRDPHVLAAMRSVPREAFLPPHDSGVAAFFLHLRAPKRDEVRAELAPPRLERAIGVVYCQETELQSHSFHAALPNQFDEYLWFDETHAVRPVTSAEAARLAAKHPFAIHA